MASSLFFALGLLLLDVVLDFLFSSWSSLMIFFLPKIGNTMAFLGVTTLPFSLANSISIESKLSMEFLVSALACLLLANCSGQDILLFLFSFSWSIVSTFFLFLGLLSILSVLSFRFNCIFTIGGCPLGVMGLKSLSSESI